MGESMNTVVMQFILPITIGILAGIASYQWTKSRKGKKKKEMEQKKFPSPEQLKAKRAPAKKQINQQTEKREEQK